MPQSPSMQKSSAEARYLNPKHLFTISAALRKLLDGDFDEGDVKILLLALRDNLQRISINSRQLHDAPPSIKHGIPFLADIAHSIAHPELKDQGPIRSYVRSMDEQMAKALSKMLRQKILSTDDQSRTVNIALPPALKPLSAYDLTIAFLSLLPDAFPFQVQHDQLAKHAADIELCILSIVHYLQLPLLDGPSNGKRPEELRHGYLAFHTWDGSHRLYAGVVNSLYEKVLSKGAESRREKPFINVFPVFNSTRPVGNEVHIDAKIPAILFAIRTESGVLALQEPSLAQPE